MTTGAVAALRRAFTNVRLSKKDGLTMKHANILEDSNDNLLLQYVKDAKRGLDMMQLFANKLVRFALLLCVILVALLIGIGSCLILAPFVTLKVILTALGAAALVLAGTILASLIRAIF